MKNLEATATLICSLLALAGCGDSKGESSGEVSSEISTSKALMEVSTEEATSGCEHLKGAVEARFDRASARSGLCTLFAVALSSSESACTTLRDSCLKGDPGDGASAAGSPLADPAQDFQCGGWQGCTATVGELETCLGDVLDAFDAVLNAYTCQDASTLQVNSGACPPPRNADGSIAIDPGTGQPYVNDSADCSASPPDLTPPTPTSCQVLLTQCPTLKLFGAP
jgi:hypothetical protein